MSPRRDRILIAEDDLIVRRLIEDVCRSQGFAADSVYEGRAAWALISSMSCVYHCVFLDIFMPGWSGDDVLALLGATLLPRRFIVIISGDLPATLRQEFEQHPNVLLVLTKPTTVEMIISAIKYAAEQDLEETE